MPNKNESYIPRAFLAFDVRHYIDQIFKNKKKRIYILSEDEIEPEAVMLSVDEYEDLKKITYEYKILKSIQQTPALQLFQDIRNDLNKIKKATLKLKKTKKKSKNKTKSKIIK